MTVSDRTHRDYTPAPEPPDELERLKALHDLAILDTDPEEAYDDLAALASFICGVPIALVILLDMMMPGMDGPATLQALRANPGTASIPIVFLTAKALPLEVERLRQLGAAGVITKPFDPMTLAREARRVLDE